MKRQTILLVDTDKQRGGRLEQGLSRRGLNVFRTSRGREASNLLRVLKPNVLLIALDGSGRQFYQRIKSTLSRNEVRCFVLSQPPDADVLTEDVLFDLETPFEFLLQSLYDSIMEGRVPRERRTRFRRDATIARTVEGNERLSQAHAAGKRVGSEPPAAASRGREWRGSLEQLDIVRLLSVLNRRRATGKLLLSQSDLNICIWFRGGMMIGAESSYPVPALPDHLVESGILSAEMIEHQRDMLYGPQLGERLFEAHLVDRVGVERVNRAHTEQVILAGFAWTTGSFAFLSGAQDMPSDPIKCELSLLLLRGVRSFYTRERLLGLLGSAFRVPSWPNGKVLEPDFPLHTMDRQVLSLIDGQLSMEEIKQSMRLDDVHLYALIYIMTILGYLTLQDVEHTGSNPAFRRMPSRSVGRAQRPGFERTRSSVANFDRTKSSIAGFERSASRAGLPRTASALSNLPTARSIPIGGDQTSSVHTPTMSFRAMSSNSRGAARGAHGGRGDFQQRVGAGPRPDSPEAKLLFEQVEQKYKQVMSENYFQILGISEQANELEIRRAYQRLKQTFAEGRFAPSLLDMLHPKLQEVHQTIQEAYEVLSEGTVREQYRQNMQG